MPSNTTGENKVTNTYELERRIESLIKYGFDQESIMRMLRADVQDEILLEESVERVCESYPNFELIQRFMGSKIVVNKDESDDKLYMYDEITGDAETISKIRLNEIITSKLDWGNRRYTCEFVYNPLETFKLRKKAYKWEYNTYKPPFWCKEYFISQGKNKLPHVEIIPEVYDKFLKHLTNDDDDSYNYILNWLATMLQSRNYCILTTIGNQGIGKGVLGEIMSRLVGESNFTLTDNKVLDKDFNNQIFNKRLVYVDEAMVKKTEQENKLKALVNDKVEIEGKGKDAKLTKNYSSIYFSSNDIDSIRIPADDRRFSVVNLTEVKLLKVFKKEEIKSLLKRENIEELAYYLMNREIDQDDMLKVFISARTEELRDYGRKPWEEWFVDTYCASKAGITMEVLKVGEDIEAEFGSRFRIGRSALKKLQGFYPGVFTVKNKRFKGAQTWVVEFHKQLT